MTIDIHIGNDCFYGWSSGNWYCFRRIFYAGDILRKKVKDVLPYLEYRIQWLKAQGYDDTSTALNTFGQWNDETRNDHPLDNLKKYDYELKSQYLRMIIILRDMCLNSRPSDVVWYEQNDDGNTTNVDLVETRTIIQEPIGAYTLSIRLKSISVASHLREAIIDYFPQKDRFEL